eukprot:scaffold181434_cov31-Tisochrysis_lutea.AAC.4
MDTLEHRHPYPRQSSRGAQLTNRVQAARSHTTPAAEGVIKRWSTFGQLLLLLRNIAGTLNNSAKRHSAHLYGSGRIAPFQMGIGAMEVGPVAGLVA